jgi:hypothetical protein
MLVVKETNILLVFAAFPLFAFDLTFNYAKNWAALSTGQVQAKK